MRPCPRCGSDNPDDGRFCHQCGLGLGDPLPPPDEEETMLIRFLSADAHGATGAARVWLIDPRGEQVDNILDLGDLTVIGRRRDCNIVLPDNSVSRQHARIRREGDRYFIADAGSTNGTLLNEEPLIKEEPLQDRDEICVGTYKLIFRVS